jgi:SAM-dependent methyltransferase
MAALTHGNAAKLYCLQLLDEAIRHGGPDFRIVDLGCGDGRNFVELVRRHPHVRYIGVDPSRRGIEHAKEALPEAELVHMQAYDARFEPADAVVSFSVLEHVADRRRYMEALRANVKPKGRVYLNYDAGHFVADADARERAKAAVARAFAAAGYESRYRAPVRSEEFAGLVERAALRIVDDKGFNTELKLSYRAVSESQRDLFMDSWLAFELSLNDSGFGYDERLFRTRNVLLVPSD